MGKKSLIKSTTKKKASSPKKSASKQTPTSAKSSKSTQTKKPVNSKKASTTTSKTPPKSARKSIPVAELLKRSFDAWSPDKSYEPSADLVSTADYTAPPFIEGTDEKAKTVKALLHRQFDLAAPPEPAAEEKPPAADAVPEVDDSTEKTADETPTTTEEIPKPPEAQKTDETPAPEPTATAEPEKSAPPLPEPPAESASWSPPPPTCAGPPEEKEPPNMALRVLIGCLAAIFGLLVLASALNSNNYYLEPTASGLEIWRGKFSPKGKTLVETLPDVDLSVPVKSVYDRDEAMTVVFEYFMNQANQRAGVAEEPDFKAIADRYAQAKTYAPTSAQAALADNRLRTIKAQSLMSEADEAAANPTPQNIDKALALLHEAAELATDRTQQQLIRVKIDELTAEKTGSSMQDETTPGASENKNQ